MKQGIPNTISTKEKAEIEQGCPRYYNFCFFIHPFSIKISIVVWGGSTRPMCEGKGWITFRAVTAKNVAEPC